MSSENGVVYINGGENHDVYLFADTDSSGSFSAGDVAVQLIGVGKGAASSMLDIDSDAFII